MAAPEQQTPILEDWESGTAKQEKRDTALI